MHNRNIPFFDYPSVFLSEEENLTHRIVDVCRRGAFILQNDLELFETNLAQFCSARYAIGVANCTDAMIIALQAAGLRPGDEVIFCSHTFVATAAAIHFAGGIPIPTDCGPDHLIDPDSVARAITPRTRCVMPTQLNGRTCDMDALMAVAERHNLFIVEDAAQALGSKFKERCAGTFGLAGAISFYPAKSLGCFGDGGAILTNEAGLYEKMRCLRDHGRNHDGEVSMWGLNSRLDNLQAAILDEKLKTFSKVIERRRQLAAIYESLLNEISAVSLPPGPEHDIAHFDTFQNYEIQADNRDQLKEFLRTKGIGTIIQWNGKAVHQFKALGLHAELPGVEGFFQRCLMLPMNISLSDQDARYICASIREFYGK